MFLDFLFPKTCLACGVWGSYICPLCQKKLQYVTQDNCLFCEKRSHLGLVCEDCLRPYDIDGHMSVFYANATLRFLIKKIKYRLVYDAFKELFRSLDPVVLSRFQRFKEKFPDCVMQPVPLHTDRHAARGFNQSLYIAQFFSSLLSYPVVDVVVRARKTLPQAQTPGRLERHLNIHNAFKIRKNHGLEGRNIIIVDDIFTSGNTTREIARICKKARINKAFVFSLAKG